MTATERGVVAAVPLLSVVVPIYDVAPYLPACLASLAGQQLDDLEVICIDDGSRDDSAAIAEAFAATDPRFRVLRQANVGLGATRNRGAEEARGTYLAFVDSDDLVHADAYRRMVTGLEASGSDFATGNVHRLTSLGLRQSPMFAAAFATSRRATHVTRDHTLLTDRIVPNKVFRRAFFTGHAFRFPSGVHYEDTPVTIPAHVLADAVDVHAGHVYVWRMRSGADRSITQRRLEVGNLEDRFRAVTRASSFLADGGWEAEWRAYDRMALTDDLRLFSSLLDLADDERLAAFVAEGRAFLARAHPQAVADAPALERLKWHLVEHGSPEELARVARFERLEAAATPALLRRGRVIGDLPLRTERQPPIPPDVFAYDREVDLQTRVTGFALDPERLEIRGWAYLRHVPVTRSRRRRVRLWLVDDARGTSVEMRVEPVVTPEASARARPDVYDYDLAGFRATVPTAALTDRWQSGVDHWRVEVEVRGGRYRRRGPLAGVEAGAARRPEPVDVGRLRIGARTDGPDVRFAVAARVVTLEDVQLADDGPVLTLSSRRTLQAVQPAGDGGRAAPVTGGRVKLPWSWLAGPSAAAAVDAAQGDAAAVDAALGDAADSSALGDAAVADLALLHDPVADASDSRALRAVDTEGRAFRVVAAPGLDQHVLPLPDGRAAAVEITRYGNVSVAVHPPALVVEEAQVRAGTFVLQARLVPAAAAGTRVVLTLVPGDRRDPRPVTGTLAADGTVTLVLDVAAWPSDEQPAEGARPLPAGTWRLDAAMHDTDGTRRPLALRLPRSLAGRLPLDVSLDLPPGAKQVYLDDLGWQRLAVVATDDLAPTERGRFNQRRLAARAVTAGGTRGGAQRATGSGAAGRPGGGILAIGADGRRYADGVRAVVEELRRRAPGTAVQVAVRDAQVAVAPPATPVPLWSAAFHRALAQSDVVVTDRDLPAGFRRRAGQRVVRVWPGTPLRPVGLDHPDLARADARAREAVVTAARQWTHLVVGNDHSAELLRAAYGYDGEVLVVGDPGLDLLGEPTEAARRAGELRATHAVPADAPLIVVLPSAFDHLRHPGGALRLVPGADLRHLRAAGGDHARLLLAVPPAVPDRLTGVDPAAAADPGITTAAEGSDLAVLLAAADVVVTHPSSLALDAVSAGRRVVVHDPPELGLAHHPTHPVWQDWPRTGDTDALVAAVRGLLAATGAQTAGHRPPDDLLDVGSGAAATRLADAVLGGTPTLPS